MKVLSSLLLALNILAIKSYFITELFDVYQVDPKCIALYFNIKIFYFTENDFKRCSRDIYLLEKSFYKTIEENLESQAEKINVEVENCAINFLEFHNIFPVAFKALAYHQKLLNFTTNSKQSCKDVVKFNTTLTVAECGIKVMAVESIGVNKSFVHLKHCFNDLFEEFKPDKIVFDDSEISKRLFGKHFMEFLVQLSAMGVKYCGNDEKTQVENIEDIAVIDIFGLTQPSKRVENCIERKIKKLKNFNFDEKFAMSQKRLIEIVVTCLKEF